MSKLDDLLQIHYGFNEDYPNETKEAAQAIKDLMRELIDESYQNCDDKVGTFLFNLHHKVEEL